MITVFITTLILFIPSCGRETEISSFQKTDIELQYDNSNILFKQTLERQLEKGVSGLYDSSFDISTYNFTEKDLNVIIPSLGEVLKNNGYILPTQDEFKHKIVNFFGRTLDYTTESSFIVVYSDYDNKCNRQIAFYRNTNNIDLYPPVFYVLKKERFITPLFSIPEIIDYKKVFPNEYNDELKMDNYYYDTNKEKIQINKWAEVDDLPSQQKYNITTLLHRNKYLFNDCQASLTWLFNNDPWFVEGLVKIFGYVKDEKLLNWLLERNRFKNESGRTNGFEYGKTLWCKDCSGKLNFHKEVLDMMKEKLTPDYPGYLDDLLEYVEYLQNNEDQNPLLKFSEKALIIANILYFVQSMAEIKEYKKYEYKAMGRFSKLYDHDAAFDQEFEKNNYYNLPGFKEFWEEAKENGDGTNYYS